MLSKNKIKYIKSLERKKERDEANCFLAEGDKLIEDMLSAFECELLIATETWLKEHSTKAKEVIIAEEEEIKRASLLKSPQHVLAIFKKPTYILNIKELDSQLSLMLDNIQDPGNLGTIIRIANWFGIKQIICSSETVDCYNPKVVQATMGALSEVRIFYSPLKDILEQIPEIPVYGTFLDGENMYEKSLSPNGIIMMGNEGNGISKDMEKYVSEKLFIPSYPPNKEPSAESLNVAVATAIVCAEFRRRQF
jgi:rRNA methylases